MTIHKTIFAAAALSASALAATPHANAQSAMDQVYNSLPSYDGQDLELLVDQNGTHFALWSPQAQDVRVNLYRDGRNYGSNYYVDMTKDEHGVWRGSSRKDLTGWFYTFSVLHDGKWLEETPGVWAKAVGINGKRAAIIDFAKTNPEGWEKDHGPELKSYTDAIIYEMHHRDFSVHPSSGIANKGKFLALTEKGTVNGSGIATGIDHLKELGGTHIHIRLQQRGRDQPPRQHLQLGL